MKIALAGSRDIRTDDAGRLLTTFLAARGPEDCILLRRGAVSPPGAFEAMIAGECAALGVPFEWRIPEGSHREGVHQRDYQMVRDADLVIALMRLEQVGDEECGTFRLVDKAMFEHTPVYAYAIEDGHLDRIGEDDPKNRFASVVPDATR
jgi:hypothetical protein